MDVCLRESVGTNLGFSSRPAFFVRLCVDTGDWLAGVVAVGASQRLDLLSFKRAS